MVDRLERLDTCFSSDALKLELYIHIKREDIDLEEDERCHQARRRVMGHWNGIPESLVHTLVLHSQLYIHVSNKGVCNCVKRVPRDMTFLPHLFLINARAILQGINRKGEKAEY